MWSFKNPSHHAPRLPENYLNDLQPLFWRGGRVALQISDPYFYSLRQRCLSSCKINACSSKPRPPELLSRFWCIHITCCTSDIIRERRGARELFIDEIRPQLCAHANQLWLSACLSVWPPGLIKAERNFSKKKPKSIKAFSFKTALDRNPKSWNTNKLNKGLWWARTIAVIVKLMAGCWFSFFFLWFWRRLHLGCHWKTSLPLW